MTWSTIGLLFTLALAIATALVLAFTRRGPRLRVVTRIVACPRSHSEAICELQRDDRRGIWTGVLSCSELQRRGGILCDAQCLEDLNRGAWRVETGTTTPTPTPTKEYA